VQTTMIGYTNLGGHPKPTFSGHLKTDN